MHRPPGQGYTMVNPQDVRKADAWWLAAPEEAATGLTQAEAAVRLLQFGPNRIQDRRQVPWVLQYLGYFKNPLVLILLAASGVSAAAGELTNFLIIACIVLLSVTLDFVQEYRRRCGSGEAAPIGDAACQRPA